MFVYGPPGNGKTVIAQAIRGLLDGEMAVPHALEVEGNIIRLFDPVNHEPLESPATTATLSLSREAGHDRRWVRCRRPLVMVGGELTLESLELAYSKTTGFYTAPIQAVANGGVLVIDDFGRQRCSARDLLNRWIVPLESRVDFLTLQQRPEVRAAVPAARRVRHEHPAVGARRRSVPAAHSLQGVLPRARRSPTSSRSSTSAAPNVESTTTRRSSTSCSQNYYRPRKLALRGCHPRDLLDQALAQASYLGEDRRLTSELLEAACASYFVDDTEPAPVFV